LQFTITASDVHRMLRIPALTVATLVENAVRHGISPKPEGGAVRVTVDADNDSLVIQVSDNGVGLRQASGSGLGLATVRACLRSRFGERAVLRVEPAEPAGVRAAIRIPQEA
ncbi:MAG: ATP-binding protein, partial [Burkholderiaceae bacterium]